jgi:hypothetical protein
MKLMIERNLDIDDVLYKSAQGPITVNDVIYGYGPALEKTGNDFYAHKTGFTSRSLTLALRNAGFKQTLTALQNLEVIAIGFKNEPTEYAVNLFREPVWQTSP